MNIIHSGNKKVQGLPGLTVNNMVITETRPESGQFTALWTFDGQQWSATLDWVDGVLMEWQPKELDESRGDGEWITWHEPDTMVTSDLIYVQVRNNGAA